MSHSLFFLFVLALALVPLCTCWTPSQHVRSVVHPRRHVHVAAVAESESSASASASVSALIPLSFQQKPTIAFHTLQTTQTPTFPPINSSGIPNPPPETTRNILSGDIYTNSTGVRLYYPDMMRMVHDWKTPFSSTILEMYQTSWNDNTVVVLSSTADIFLRQQYIRLYLAFTNGTRREILRDFWIDTSHPWYLGQTIGFNKEVSTSQIVLTFEGRVSGEDPNQFMALGFHVMDLSVSPDRLFPWRANQTKAGDLVEVFRLIEKPEPTYYRDGTVANATYILTSRETLVTSQVSGYQNYQLIPVEPIVSPPVEQGFLLLLRCRLYGGIRLIKYTDKMEPIFQTLLVPEIVNPFRNDYQNLSSTVGHVKVDPDGRVYVLVDVADHEIEAVMQYQSAFLSQRNQQTCILFVLRDDGSIIRGDWVPIAYPMMSGQITTAITVQQGQGRCAIIHVGITQQQLIASVIEYLDYDTDVTPLPAPRSRAALIHTLPPSIRDTCVITSRQVTVYTVTALTDGKYALAGTHGYGQDGANNGNPYPTSPGTAFVAIVDLEKLLTDNSTSLRVHNFGSPSVITDAVLKRDAITTHVIATPTGYLVGAVVDRSLRNEPQQQLRYQHTAIFQGTLTTANRICAPVNGTGGWVTCGREMCLSWCSTMTPSSIDTSINIAQDATCAAIKDNLSVPTSGPSSWSSSSSPSDGVKLGVGLGLGLGGGLLLLCGLAFCLKKRQASDSNTRGGGNMDMDGVDMMGEGRGQRTDHIPHQPLREETEGM